MGQHEDNGFDDRDVVYELTDEDFYPDAADHWERLPTLPFRERVRALVPTRESLPTRATARRIGAALLVAGLSAGATAVGTTLVDDASASERNADTVALVVDAITDGSPSAATANLKAQTATAQYIVEFANNGPEAVTVDKVALTANLAGDNGMRMTGWRPLGSPILAPGGVGRVALNVALNCHQLAADGLLENVDFVLSPHLTVTTADGHRHDVDVPVTDAAPQAETAFSAIGGALAPQVDGIQNLSCLAVEQGFDPSQAANRFQLPESGLANGTPASTTLIKLAYEGVMSAATPRTQSFTLKFAVLNTSRTGSATVDASPFNAAAATSVPVQVVPEKMTLAPGQSATLEVTFQRPACDFGDPGATFQSLQLDTVEAQGTDDLPAADFLTGVGLQVFDDIATQMKVVCA